MLASNIFTIETIQDKGAGPELRVKYPETQILLKARTTNVKSFLDFVDYFFCGTPKLWEPWNSLFPFHLALPRRLNKLITSWNDRRSRRVFFCIFFKLMNFQTSHFQTNEAKLETYLYLYLRNGKIKSYEILTAVRNQ